MGSVGDCYDNAVCETFHATLKKEKIYRQSWPTRAAARTAIFEYIEGWYNPRRRHSTLGYLSPVEFERHHAELARPALEASISDNGSVASTSPRAADGLTTRRILAAASISPPTPDLSRERSRVRSDPLRPRPKAVKDERPRAASPTSSQGAGSLIETSTTKVKTCRPNRGRSRRRPCGCTALEAAVRSPAANGCVVVASAALPVLGVRGGCVPKVWRILPDERQAVNARVDAQLKRV